MISIGKKCKEHVFGITIEEGTYRALVDRLEEGTIVAAFHVRAYGQSTKQFHWQTAIELAGDLMTRSAGYMKI